MAGEVFRDFMVFQAVIGYLGGLGDHHERAEWEVPMHNPQFVVESPGISPVQKDTDGVVALLQDHAWIHPWEPDTDFLLWMRNTSVGTSNSIWIGDQQLTVTRVN